jgi:TRAP-type C4-dicarboxylate transport system permease small subunit
MRKVIRWFQSVTYVLSIMIVAFAAFIIALNVLSLFFESITRYLLGTSRAFMEEFPRLLVPFFVFPMLGVLYKAGRHISVDVLPEKLSPKFRAMLKIAVSAVVLGVAAEMVLAGTKAVAQFKMMGLMSVTEWVFPMWWVYLTFPVGFGLLIIFVLEAIVSDAWQLHLILQQEKTPASTQGVER